MTTMPIDVYNPVCYVYFFPTTTTSSNPMNPRPLRSLYGAGGWGHLHYDYVGDMNVGIDIDNDIIYASTQTLINGIGTNLFTIRLVNRVDRDGLTWDQKIRSRDLVLITMKRPGLDEKLTPVMFGVVRTVKKKVKLSGSQDGKTNTVERYIEVTGNDLTALIADQYIFFNQNYLGAIATIKKILGTDSPSSVHYGFMFAELIDAQNEGKRLQELIKEPHEFVRSYIENYCLHDYQHTNIPFFGKPVSDFLQFNPESHSFALNGEQLKVYGMNFMTFTGSGANFINQVLQKPFNEIIVDYGTSPLPAQVRCHLTVRPSPFYYQFNNSDVSDTNRVTPLPPDAGNLLQYLPEQVITDLDVKDEELMVSDEGSYNLFLVDKASPGAWALDPALHLKPAFDLDNIRRYGTRATIMSFDYFPAPTGNNEEELADSVKETTNYCNGLAEVLRQWFIKQPEYLQGEITIKGRAGIRIGQRLTYISKERNETIEFYIHGVRHTFINFGSFLTTLSLSRGRVVGFGR